MADVLTAPTATADDLPSLLLVGAKPGSPATLVQLPVKRLLDLLSSSASGLARFATVALMQADTGRPDGTLAYVFANAGSPADPANGYYQRSGPNWVAAPWVGASFAQQIDAKVAASRDDLDARVAAGGALVDARGAAAGVTLDARAAAAGAALDVRVATGDAAKVSAQASAATALTQADRAGTFAGQLDRPDLAELRAVLASSASALAIVEATGAGANPAIFRSVAWTAGSIYVAEFLAKANGRPVLNVYCNASAVVDINFDLVGGVTTARTAGTASMERLGGGWWRCRLEWQATQTGSGNLQLRPSQDGVTFTYAGDGVSGVLVPDFDLRVKGAAVGLLPSRLLSDASWTKRAATIAPIAVRNAPIGGQLALLDERVTGLTTGPVPLAMIESTANSEHRLYRNVTVVAGRTYRLWAEVRASGRARTNLYAADAALTMNGEFNLATGAVTGSGAAIIARGGDEYRVEVVATATASKNLNAQIRLFPANGGAPYLGDGASGIHLLAAGWDEDGVTIGGSNAAALLSAAWVKNGVTLAPAVVPFQSAVQRAATDAVGRAAPAAVAAKPFAGMKWAALGDSITAQGKYTSALQARSGMILTNLGVSGQTIGTTAGTGASNDAVIRQKVNDIPADTQIVTLLGGINDFALQTPLGQFGDLTKATFYGAMHEIIRAIWEKVPNARLFVASPTPGGGTGSYGLSHGVAATRGAGLRVRDYQRVVREVCEWLGVPFTNVGQQCGINDRTANRLLFDGLHPGDAGGDVIAACWHADLVAKMAAGTPV